jgi:hypothetical protein
MAMAVVRKATKYAVRRRQGQLLESGGEGDSEPDTAGDIP